MRENRDYSDIPGTYVFDSHHSMLGYPLNMFCMSLNKSENRDKFRANESSYLDQYPVSEEQRKAILERDWLGMLRLGGNIYYTFKLAIFDGLTMQKVGGLMSGVEEEEFKAMMIAGGRKPEGNRYKSEWEKK
ncbi:protocatechuate 4,5-dioxygenase subunit alpha [Paraglaciecola arctica]|uniref:protocatechuate 4,5-dioxygenase subunit alpha n=1 Tax=Paraglaciecola arctica TaxID=1128911 RepID=UPI001C0708C2|nr:protocatechuate 4,5-dioxygenase subunit alpha [Paraglaciecola arctica]MBU3002955.1 protocatechuate 4,5-dioxygenase subunit alpha [Paraglaciecola arctica]